MRYIVVDLEMNRMDKKYKEERQICNMEIIEIGAVMLDDSFREIAHYKTYVKPQFSESIGAFYEKLTGITTAMVEDAPVFEDAIRDFLAWCKADGTEVQICTWSDTDYSQVAHEMKLKNYEPTKDEKEVLRDWYDFQKEYGEVVGFSKAVSLENALLYAGVDFQGRQHDALVDARNTAELLLIVRDESKREKALGKAIEAMQEKEMGTSLGEMFDFSAFLVN